MKKEEGRREEERKREEEKKRRKEKEEKTMNWKSELEKIKGEKLREEKRSGIYYARLIFKKMKELKEGGEKLPVLQLLDKAYFAVSLETSSNNIRKKLDKEYEGVRNYLLKKENEKKKEKEEKEKRRGKIKEEKVKEKEIKENKEEKEKEQEIARRQQNLLEVQEAFKSFVKGVKKQGSKTKKHAEKQILKKEEKSEEKPAEKQDVPKENEKGGEEQMEKYMSQKVTRHYYIESPKEELSNKKVQVGEVVIHFTDKNERQLEEEIFLEIANKEVKKNSSEIFEEFKKIKNVKGKLGGVVYIMVSTFRAMKQNGVKRHLLELFKELNVPMAQDILDKKVRKDGKTSLLLRISKKYLEGKEELPSIDEIKGKGFNSILGYLWYTESKKEKSPLGDTLLLLYGRYFKELNLDDPNLWKSKLNRKVKEGIHPSANYESIKKFYSENTEEVFPLDKENGEKDNKKVTVQIQLPVVLKLDDKYRVTKFIPNSVKVNGKNIPFPFDLARIISGMRKQVVSTAFVEMQERNLEGVNGKGKNLIMALYKLIDLDELMKEYPIYKNVLIGWFNMSLEPAKWFKNYKDKVTDKSVYGYFSPDVSNKNNPLGLVAPACNIPGQEHLSWLGLAINPLEGYTGDHGKRLVGNAVIKAFPIKISNIPFDKIGYKSKGIKEELLTGSLAWELVVTDFERNFTSIGEGALITEWGKEKVEGELEGKIEKGQPFKVHNEGAGEKSLLQGISSVAEVRYHGTEVPVFKGPFSDENVAIIRAYNKRRNFVSTVGIGRLRANKVLNKVSSYKPILVDAYDENGELVYEGVELVLQKIFIDLTLDRRPMIIRQNNSSVQQEVLTFDMGNTKLPYQKYKEKVEKRNKEAKEILYSAYYYLSRGRIVLNKHQFPVIQKHPEKKMYLLDEETIQKLRKNGIVFHGRRFFLPSYSTYIEGIGTVANDILTYVLNMSKYQAADKDVVEKQTQILLNKIQNTYERLEEIRIPMVRARLALKKNMGLREMHVSPSILKLLVEDTGDERALEVIETVGPKEFLRYYNIEVYGVRFPDFGYSGDYRISVVDENLFETAAVSTLNAALIGGDVDDDTISLKIVSMKPIKGKLPPSPKEDNKKEILLQKLLEEEKKFLGEKGGKEEKETNVQEFDYICTLNKKYFNKMNGHLFDQTLKLNRINGIQYFIGNKNAVYDKNGNIFKPTFDSVLYKYTIKKLEEILKSEGKEDLLTLFSLWINNKIIKEVENNLFSNSHNIFKRCRELQVVERFFKVSNLIGTTWFFTLLDSKDFEYKKDILRLFGNSFLANDFDNEVIADILTPWYDKEVYYGYEAMDKYWKKSDVSKKLLSEMRKEIKEDEISPQQEKEKKENILENNQLEDEPLNKEVINMEKETKEPNVEFYVDGSYNSVTDKVGSAYIGLVDGKPIFKGTAQLSNKAGLRNVFGEIAAALAAVKLAKKKGYPRIKIYYDYSGIEKWVTEEWKAKNQITQKYSKLMQNSGVSIEFVKVKAHSGNKWNEVVDKMARDITISTINSKNL